MRFNIFLANQCQHICCVQRNAIDISKSIFWKIRQKVIFNDIWIVVRGDRFINLL